MQNSTISTIIMVSFTTLLGGVVLFASAISATPTPKVVAQPVVTYLGTQGAILCRLHHAHLCCHVLTFLSWWSVHDQRHSLHCRNRSLGQWYHHRRRYCRTNSKFTLFLLSDPLVYAMCYETPLLTDLRPRSSQTSRPFSKKPAHHGTTS